MSHDLRGRQLAAVFHGRRAGDAVLDPAEEGRGLGQLRGAEARARPLPQLRAHADLRGQQAGEFVLRDGDLF